MLLKQLMEKEMKYCESIHKTKRWATRQVMVGNVGLGGLHPVRIQSMTTSNTRDVEATIVQIIKLAEAGCEIARLTVQGMKEAEACEHIKNGLIQRGYTIPLVADIHFYPPAAMRVVEFVDKVRINPGNFIDKRASFKAIDYDDASYACELEKIEEKFTPLVDKCKRLKRAMRIGTNHGSLSDRIMNRYGDTPRGMLESALEFARVCRQNEFHDFVFSMKSSNPQVMVQAYRLLVAEMLQLGWDYPLHLGVTEAGEGEDGRIKSAMGIGALLLDGIGDTLRVSLTEDPWLEIDPCQRLIALANDYAAKPGVAPFVETQRCIAEIKRRTVVLPKDMALHRDGTVFVYVPEAEVGSAGFFKKLGCDSALLGRPKLKASSADCLVLRQPLADPQQLQAINQLKEIGLQVFVESSPNGAFSSGELCLTALTQAAEALKIQRQAERFSINLSKKALGSPVVVIKDEQPEAWMQLLEVKPSVIFLAPSDNRLHYCRQFFDWLQSRQITTPVILNFSYTCSKEDLIIRAAAECGALLCDGLGDGLLLEAPFDLAFMRTLSFNLLQAARMRSSKTDFISCPSCGRTLFDLQEVTKRIHARTAHLPGVKIAIMGCIVNGPGEMADADFGYVGSKPGKIDLYVGKVCIEKDIDFGAADDRLVSLIKQHGRWQESAI